MHFRICFATILVIFCPLKRFCIMHRHISNVLHNQLSARVDSQINYSAVVHGRMQDLPRGANYFFLGGGLATRGFARGVRGHASPPKFFFAGVIWCFLEHIFINFFTFKKSKNIIFIQK